MKKYILTSVIFISIIITNGCAKQSIKDYTPKENLCDYEYKKYSEAHEEYKSCFIRNLSKYQRSNEQAELIGDIVSNSCILDKNELEKWYKSQVTCFIVDMEGTTKLDLVMQNNINQKASQEINKIERQMRLLSVQIMIDWREKNDLN